MPPVLQKTIREIHQRLRALETREYAEVVGPGSVINAQYLTLALHAVLTAERRFVDGDGLVGVDGGANADYTLNARHALLSTSHIDTLAAAVVDGDVIIGNVTPRWSRLAIAIPAANVRNVLGIDNAELRPSWKTTLDANNPADIAAAAAPGTSLIFSHRDHVHNHPAGLGVNLHHNEIHVVNSTGPHAEAGLTIGHILRVSAAAVFSFAALQAGDIPGLGGVPALTFGLANAAGAAATYIQTDASIAIFDAVVPGTIQCDDAANTGAVAFAARRDHQHAIVCAIAVDIANANAEGTEYTFARSDHVHNHPAALGANLHHTQIHDVVGGDHTLTGAQWNLVGATALNTIGLLLASSNPGAAAAILMSTAAGGLTLVDLTLTNDLLLADGAVVGITGNEIITFDAAGYIIFSGARVGIGTATPNSGLTLQGASGANVTYDIYAGDGDGTDYVSINVYGVGTPDGTPPVTNRERLVVQWDAGNSRYLIQSEANGTGTLRPISIETEGNANQLYLATDGNVTIADGLNVGTATIATTGTVAIARDAGSGTLVLERIDTTVVAGDNIGVLVFRGGEDTIQTVARILAEADQDWTDPASGTRLVFSVVAQDGLVLSEAMRLDDDLVATFPNCIADGSCEIFTEDALDIIKDIHAHGTREYDDYGHEHFNMPWMFNKYPFLIHKNEVGYYDKLGAKSDLLYRAAIQLDDHRRLADAEREVLREQIGVMQNRLAVLEAA